MGPVVNVSLPEGRTPLSFDSSCMDVVGCYLHLHVPADVQR